MPSAKAKVYDTVSYIYRYSVFKMSSRTNFLLHRIADSVCQTINNTEMCIGFDFLFTLLPSVLHARLKDFSFRLLPLSKIVLVRLQVFVAARIKMAVLRRIVR
jgi:hypothetical protein